MKIMNTNINIQDMIQTDLPEDSIKLRKIEKMFEEYKEKANSDEMSDLGIYYSEILAQMYEDGFIEKDNNESKKLLKVSFDLLEKLSNKGSLSHKVKLADAYNDGIGVKKDYKKALLLYEELYKKGDSYSTLRMGVIYLDNIEEGLYKGKELEMSRKGFFYIEESLKLGFKGIENFLGIIYYRFLYRYSKNIEKEKGLNYFNILLKNNNIPEYNINNLHKFCEEQSEFCEEHGWSVKK